jgi:hypothetical protein
VKTWSAKANYGIVLNSDVFLFYKNLLCRLRSSCLRHDVNNGVKRIYIITSPSATICSNNVKKITTFWKT